MPSDDEDDEDKDGMNEACPPKNPFIMSATGQKTPK